MNENLIHLIIGYGNYRHDMAVGRERDDDFMYTKAKIKSEELLKQIKDIYFSIK